MSAPPAGDDAPPSPQEGATTAPTAAQPPNTSTYSTITSAPDAKLRFYHHFQQQSKTLDSQLDSLATASISSSERQDGLDACLAGIARLSAEAKEASSYVPAYDQRSYAVAVKALNERLAGVRRDTAPKPKFAFKARLGRGRGKQQQQHEVTQSGATPVDGDGLKGWTGIDGKLGAGDVSAVQESHRVSQDSSLSISDRRTEHIVLQSSASQLVTTATITDLRRCIVNSMNPTVDTTLNHEAKSESFASMQLKNVEDSLVVAGRINGPIHVTGLTNCVISVACRQFRMHNCKNVDVYLECSSHPIIEDCGGIRFAPLPEAHQEREGDASGNQWDQVDDFKWLKSEPSPHWSITSEGDRVRNDVWERTASEPGDGIEQILQAVGIK